MCRFSFVLLLACAMCGLLAPVTALLALDFEKCHFGDDVCCTNVGKHLLQTYGKTGLRSMNLIPFDPLLVKSLIIEKNPNSPISIGFAFKDIEIVGLANIQQPKVSGLTRDVKGPIILEGTLPKAIIRGPYQGSGTVSGLPFKGSGLCEIALTNTKLICKLNAKLVKKGADEFLTIHSVSMAISQPDNVHFKFGGLFNGNKELGETANTYVNQNWSEIFGELRPSLENAFGLILQGITKNVFAKYPYTDFFLPE